MTEQHSKNPFLKPGTVKIVQGSIVNPQNGGLRFVLSVTNMVGKTEGPFYPVIEKKWPKVKQEAKGWYNTRTGKYALGAVNTTAVQSDVWVLHLLCQDDELQTDLAALHTCLKEVCKMAKYERASVAVSSVLTEAIPELTTVLGTELVEQGVSVTFYEETVNA